MYEYQQSGKYIQENELSCFMIAGLGRCVGYANGTDTGPSTPSLNAIKPLHLGERVEMGGGGGVLGVLTDFSGGCF